MFKLYNLINKDSDTYYIGMTASSLRSRFISHRFSANKGVKTYLYNAMRLHGIDNFVMFLVAEFETREECQEAEKSAIKLALAEGHKLYNITAGGDGGWAVPDESKEQWREKLKLARAGRTPALGMSHTDETKERCRLASEEYWGSRRRYEFDLTAISFKDAAEIYGISKTHYYRIRKRQLVKSSKEA